MDREEGQYQSDALSHLHVLKNQSVTRNSQGWKITHILYQIRIEADLTDFSVFDDRLTSVEKSILQRDLDEI